MTFTLSRQEPILDGIDNNTAAPDFLNGSSYVIQPPPDALSEFNIQTSDYNAEFGHSAGAVLNATIKSGTNQIHGDLWEYFRNTALDARDFDAQTIPPYHENQFGATLGLPVWKDKVFFFGYLENNRVSFGETYTMSVPTALMRQGKFTELLNPALTSTGQRTTLYQPGSAGTQPLTCNGQINVICPSAINSAAEGILKLYPMPNANNGKLFNNYVLNSNAVTNTFQWGTRFDWNLSSKDLAFVRFSYQNSPASYVPPLGPIIDGGAYGTDGQIVNLAENFVLSETHIFNSTLTNEFRFGYNYGEFRLIQPVFNDQGLAASLGFGGIPNGGLIGGGLPFGTVDGLSNFGPPQFYPNHKGENIYEILDNVEKIRGNQSLKAGVEFLSVRFPFYSPSGPRGSYTYSGFFTSNPGKSFTGYGAADFLQDSMFNASINSAVQLDMSRWYRAAFFQDDWRATQRLTLNLGIRYDHFQPLKEISGQFASFYMQANGPGNGTATLTYPIRQKNTYLAPSFLALLAKNNIPVQYTSNPSLVSPQYLNFAPRVGFAYSLNNKTVVRAGFGLFYGGMENFSGNQELENYPFQFSSTFPRANVCKPGNCGTDGISIASGFSPYLGQGLVNSVSTPTFSGSQPHVQTPYTESFNLTIQRAFSPNLTTSVGYVGSITRHLLVEEGLNGPDALIDPRLSSKTVQPFPAFGGIGVETYAGFSSYNGLQAKIEKRYANGLSFLAAYTWAHSLDDAFDSVSGEGYRSVNLIGIQNDYTNSLFDVRNRFTFNGYYQLPVGRGHEFLNRSTVIDTFLGGWAADLEFFAQTGSPITINTDLGSAGPNGGTAHAILVRNPFAPGGTPDPSNPGIACAQHTRNKAHWYNSCAFANPPLAFPQAQVSGSPISTTRIVGLAALPYLGGRLDTVPGPGYERINISLFKDFAVYRGQYLQFRADIFNVLNTPAYGNPSVSDDSSNGGQITAPREFQNLTPDARFFQLAAKYVF